MRQLVRNGPDKHPGANFIQQRDQTKKWGSEGSCPREFPNADHLYICVHVHALSWSRFLKYGDRKRAAKELRVSCWCSLRFGYWVSLLSLPLLHLPNLERRYSWAALDWWWCSTVQQTAVPAQTKHHVPLCMFNRLHSIPCVPLYFDFPFLRLVWCLTGHSDSMSVCVPPIMLTLMVMKWICICHKLKRQRQKHSLWWGWVEPAQHMIITWLPILDFYFLIFGWL